MASLIDIRRRIKSVKNTKQITKAMKMVAASKLRRAQDRVIAARPFARTLEETLASVASRVPARDDGSAAHPLLEKREEKKVVLVTITGDKGLCGAFNTNVNRASLAFVKGGAGKGIESVRLATLGRKGGDFWKSRQVEIVLARPGIFSALTYEVAAEIVRDLGKRFVDGEIDAVYMIYNEFKSVISQIVRTKKLLPVDLPVAAEDGKSQVDYLYEPDPESILAGLVPRHVEFQLYRALLESSAAEHAARMTAMDGASKNAGEMIDSLTLIYNRARQARITKELIEIVSGAAALD